MQIFFEESSLQDLADRDVQRILGTAATCRQGVLLGISEELKVDFVSIVDSEQ